MFNCKFPSIVFLLVDSWATVKSGVGQTLFRICFVIPGIYVFTVNLLSSPYCCTKTAYYLVTPVFIIKRIYVFFHPLTKIMETNCTIIYRLSFCSTSLVWFWKGPILSCHDWVKQVWLSKRRGFFLHVGQPSPLIE